MANFPNTKYPQYGYQSWQEEAILRNNARSPKFQEKDLWNRTLFMAKMSFDLRIDDSLIVHAFWKINRGLTFGFFDYDDDIYPTEITLGTASGGAGQKFVIPGRKVRNWAWYLNHANQGAVGATIETGTGPNGEDKLVVTGAQAGGATIGIAYTGQGFFNCVFTKRPERTSNAYGRQSLVVQVQEKV